MPEPKRALTNVGGSVHGRGDPEALRGLRHALAVEPGEGLGRWTHGFHTYPARMHPDTAARLVRAFAEPGDAVLDPFCGSGTVVLEAFVAGCRGVGRELSPLGLRIAALRCAVVPEARRRELRERAKRAAGVALGRTRLGEGPRAAPARGKRGGVPEAFHPRTWLELTALRSAVGQERDPLLREALLLALSSILVKVSCRRSDTDPTLELRCQPPGVVPRLFVHKVDELARRFKQLREALPAQPEPVDLRLDDARRLDSVADASIDLVVTSPPYPNVYDYAGHQELRSEFLDLDDDRLWKGEVGARRSFQDPARGLERWQRDGEAWTAALARVLKPGGLAAVLGGDGATPLGPVRFDHGLEQWAARAGLEVYAAAAQRRPGFDVETRRAFRGDAKREHLILLRK